jgi:L-lysine exporter family protein LysE/ArgO
VSILFAEGFTLGIGLLIALGPKDTFVIKNSLGGQHALILVLICALSDVLLIVLGVLGLGTLISTSHGVMVIAMMLSIAYLLYYGVMALRAAIVGMQSLELHGLDAEHAMPRRRVITEALFHSLLTPYAWLDTVLVIGAISSTKAGLGKWWFASGAILASFLWFMFLTRGARVAAPLFRSRRAWRMLDAIVAVSMLALAIKLLGDYPWQTLAATPE